MANQWFKMYGADYLSDPKIKSLTASERSCWLTMLCYASTSTVEGEIMYLPEKQIMLDSGIDPLSEEWNLTVGFMKKFSNLRMIDIEESGIIKIINWNKRQDRKFSGYDRIKRFRERAKSKNQNEKQIQDSFDEFWSMYPRKTAKQTALRSWLKINPDEDLRKKIVVALEQHCKLDQWTKDDGRFIPHPATWLNQERWNDELKIAPPQAPPVVDTVKKWEKEHPQTKQDREKINKVLQEGREKLKNKLGFKK